ncbi:MAG: glycosyltransferase [Anaerolineae bacterium]|nr:glycosyltransferase [Anaerolineae bacterium]
MAETVSVVATVLNEANSIDALWRSLMRQSRRPDEWVIVDGGSSDGTWERLRSLAQDSALPIRLLREPGCNISRGRNIAIAAARGPLIAVTDAGVRLSDDWLEHLLAPFAADHPPDVVSGFFVSDPRSSFELALGAITLPAVEEIDPATFHPSSRSVAFRRAAWQAVGGYPEWLDYCEDLLFDFALRDAGYRFAFSPEAMVHFRPRSSLKAFVRQYYRYARGDGKADFWRYRHLIRYGTYLVAGPALLALALWDHPAWWLAVLAGALAMMRGPWRRLRPHLLGRPWRERLEAVAWVPIIRWAGDVAKMVGYPVGVAWRWRHAPKEPWPKRQL